MNTFYDVSACEVRGSLAIVVVFEAFSLTYFVVSYVLSLVVCNVDPNLSLAALAISKSYSFTNPMSYPSLSQL
jgi:hypothetical protein